MIYSIRLLLELRSYRAKISYKLVNSEETIETEDDFVIVYAVKQPWATSSFFIAPAARLDDGIMWLLLVRRSRVNRLKMLKIMLGFETAQYLNVEGVEMLPVTYFKLQPLSSGSYITIDGEVLETDDQDATIEAQIMPKKLNILLK